MLNALQASHSPSGAAFRAQTARSQDSAGGIAILPGGAAGAVRGRVELLLDATAHQAALIEAIHEARTSIKADLHLLRGPAGQELARALARRAANGLRVQLLAWGPATGAYDDLIAAARGLGLVVRRGVGAGHGGAHAKALIVDDRLAVVGVIGGPQATRGRRALARVAGEAAWELGRQFNHDWAAAGGHPLPLPDLATLALTTSSAAILVGGTGPSRKAARGVVLAALRRARRSIEVMADALDDPQAIAALVEARRRGVAVRVLLGDAADLGGPLAGLGLDPRAAAIAALAAAGVPVRFLTLGGGAAPMGLRAAVIDGDALVLGSAAWTRAGLGGGGEVALEVKGDANAKLLRAVFEADWQVAAPAALPGAVRRVAAAIAPALQAFTRLVKRSWRVPDLRVGVVKMGGRYKLVTDVR